MNSNHEMLKYAAKAARYDLAKTKDGYPLFVEGYKIWNPLEDDGDALRLAVKLDLSIVIDKEKQVNVGRWDFDEDFIELISSDPYAATRRAIVHAAAEIGRRMK